VRVRAIAIPPKTTGPDLERPAKPAPGKDTATPTIVARTWILTHLDGKPVDEAKMETPASLAFDTSPARLSGWTGCNSMGGPYTLEKTTVRIGPVVATKMFCLRGMEVERALLAVFDRVRSWRLRDGALELLDASGRAVARFTAGTSF
jgi:heat shock protein HslJ